MNITVDIERLIVEGIDLPHHQRPLVQAAVEAELARLLSAHQLGAHLLEGGAITNLPTQTIQWANDPAAFGTQIAQAVYGGMSKPE